MALKCQLYYTFPAVLMLALLCEANQATIPNDSAYSITNLYENLLQREYPGPVAFPDHQVERKAQRSPSLRLRFGRRSDPDMEPMVEKRWFGDVHQKPIRSPSLRLRFGRRSDPTMPVHSDFDVLMNELAKGADYNNGLDFEYDEPIYERAIRAPRLRWGRSVAGNQFDTEVDKSAFDRIARSPLRLRFGRSPQDGGQGNFPIPTIPPWILTAVKDNADDVEQVSQERIARSPLRLRFGRSAQDGGQGNFPIPTIPPYILTAAKDNIAHVEEVGQERIARSPQDGQGNFPIPTIPPYILTAVREPKNTPGVSDAATKN